MSKRKKHPFLRFLLFLVILGVLAYLFLFYFDWRGVVDGVKAHQFQPSPEITNLEKQLNLTDRGRNLYYALSPQLQTASDFNQACSKVSDVESGFLLGCYSATAGMEQVNVFNAGATATTEQRELFDYDSSKLVTIAHEILHGAYERRRWQSISAIDQALSQVASQVKQKCQASAPLSIDNCQVLATDMENYTSLNHSELYARLGTEIPLDQLPASLATDYKIYFVDTSDIVNRFQKNRQQEKEIKEKIETMKANLESAEKDINYLTQQYYAHPTYDGYYNTNSAINTYNRQVEEYNNLIKLYNATFVEQLNSKSTQILNAS